MNFISRLFETLQIIIKPLFMTLVLANHFYFISFIGFTIYTGILVDYIASPQCFLYMLCRCEIRNIKFLIIAKAA